MAWTYGFFNSVNGDRLYNAYQLSTIFEGLITDGVYESVGNKLAVQPNSGMVIQIATGRGWFAKHWVNNDSENLLTLQGSDVLLNRYVAVCIRVDDTDAVRSAVPYLKYSDFATNPVKPTMTRSETIHEYCLAYVYIRAGATEILASDIEDTRFNADLCGWVTGLITQVDATTLFSQWQALFEGFMTQETEDFNDWFENLQVELDGEVATRLTNALPTAVTVTLLASGWSNNSQSVQVINMNTTKSVIVEATEASKDAYTGAGIKCTAQAVNTLTFTCENVPIQDVQVNILHMGV